MSRKDNLAGMVFSDLTVLAFADIDPRGHSRWLCRCSCGVEKIVRGSSMKSGNTKSCGHNVGGPKGYRGPLQRPKTVAEHRRDKRYKAYDGPSMVLQEDWQELP